MFFGRKPKTCCTHLPSNVEDKKENGLILNDMQKQKKIAEEKKIEDEIKNTEENIDDVLTGIDLENKYQKKIKKEKKKSYFKFQCNLMKIMNEHQDMVDYRLSTIARRLDSLEEVIRIEIDNIKKNQTNIQEWDRYLFNSN